MSLKILTLDGEPSIFITSSLLVTPSWISASFSDVGRLPRCSTIAAQPAIIAIPETAKTEDRHRRETVRQWHIGHATAILLKHARAAPISVPRLQPSAVYCQRAGPWDRKAMGAPRNSE